MGKWWWRFHMERESLWGKVIESKYMVQDNGWDAGVALTTTFRFHWKFVSRIYSLFQQSVKIKIGKGNKVRFQKDTWAANQSLKNRFTNLFLISKLKNKPISSFLAEPTTLSNIVSSLGISSFAGILRKMKTLSFDRSSTFFLILD